MIFLNLRRDSGSLFYKDALIKDLYERTKGQKFNISYTVPTGRDTGFRYLLDYYHVKQTGDWSDALIQVKIPPGDSQIVFGNYGYFIPKKLEGVLRK